MNRKHITSQCQYGFWSATKWTKKQNENAFFEVVSFPRSICSLSHHDAILLSDENQILQEEILVNQINYMTVKTLYSHCIQSEWTTKTNIIQLNMLACKIIATNYFNEFHDILDVVSKKMSINRDP